MTKIDNIMTGLASLRQRKKPSMTRQPYFTLCYTSCRPEAIQPAIRLWLERAASPEHVEVILALDRDDHACWEAVKSLPPEWGVKVVQQALLPGNCVRGWNRAASDAKGDILIAIADDFLPPAYWDLSLRDLEFGPSLSGDSFWWDTDCIVQVSDGYNKELATLVIMTSRRYRRFGYLFYPLYESMYCDTEVTAVAEMEEAILLAKHLFFEHLHPDAGKRKRDATDLKHASPERYRKGQTIFKFRAAMGFPQDHRKEPWNPLLTAVFQVIKDDFCLREVCDRLADEGVTNFFFYVPSHLWNGTPVSPEMSQSIHDLSYDLAAERNVSSVCIDLDITPFKHEGDNFVKHEGRVRNHVIKFLNRCGLDHFLIVDSDEYWRKGLVAEVRKRIEQRAPVSISAGMVPVVGLPGYPVKNAQDRAVIYIRSDGRFSECRTPHGRPSVLPGYPVIHFTACRRTQEEIVTKLRASGHYDDDRYDFEGFIRDTLPTINETSRNVHFYRGHQIWPEMRVWTADEFAELPDTLKPFLTDKVETSPSQALPA